MYQPPAATAHCFGFHPWKHGYVRKYLQATASKVRFPINATHAELSWLHPSDVVVVWGSNRDEVPAQFAAAHGFPVWRMEDGFLRSVGLGSDRTVPASLVLDRRGIYYDPAQPSDLEHLLQHASFDGEELARATALRESIVTQGLSKYNVGDSRTALPSPPASRAVVLVPGQVEDDASIRLGTKSVCTNAALLQRAREARPGAFLLFKPHPDVVSGNRQGHVADPVRRNLADAVVLDAPLSACLAMADEVHTMTSLVGFEALLREIPVVTYGQPFYAGWGLTTDVEPCVRRTARRSLDELVAATLIRYPLYLHPDERVLTSPEAVVDYLRRGVEHGKPPVQMPWAKRQLMKARNAIRGVVLG